VIVAQSMYKQQRFAFQGQDGNHRMAVYDRIETAQVEAALGLEADQRIDAAFAHAIA
jgi:hypothetical protein